MPTIYEVLGLAEGIEWSEAIYQNKSDAALHALYLQDTDSSAKYYVRERNLQTKFKSLKENEEDLT